MNMISVLQVLLVVIHCEEIVRNSSALVFFDQDLAIVMQNT